MRENTPQFPFRLKLKGNKKHPILALRIQGKTKKSIWEYIQTLFVLGESFLQENSEIIHKTSEIHKCISESEMNRFEDDSVNEFSNDFLQKIK